MYKVVLGIVIGAFFGWLITADLYGRISTNDTIGGIVCRMYGLDGVRVYDQNYFDLDREYVCIDLSHATPEEDLWEDLKERIRTSFSVPR